MPTQLRTATDWLRDLAERTPETRERLVDLVRAFAITSVVLGHWLLIAVTETNGEVDGHNALRDLDWAHPLTWLFQVMPLFFFVGGFANTASFQSHQAAGGDAWGWAVGRIERLLRPTVALVAVIVTAAIVATSLGVDTDLVGSAAWLATLPLWFLVAYLAVVVLAPIAIAAQQRWGLVAILVLVALAAAGDVGRLGPEVEWVGTANYLFVWLAIHQVGIAWRLGQISAGPTVGLPIAVVGTGCLLVLTVVGPYPVSMVGVPGEDIDNAGPPTLALLSLAAAQIGLALALRNRLQTYLRRPRVWMAVVAVNAVILTLFLWHMAAAIVATVLTYSSGLFDAADPVGSTAWLLLRIPWIAVCAAVLAVLVAGFAPFELGGTASEKGGRLEGTFRVAITAVGVATVLAALLGIALAGRSHDGVGALPTWSVVGFAAGTALLYLVGVRGQRSANRQRRDPHRP